jgi:hypothetical protein
MTWDEAYGKYYNTLRNGALDESSIRGLYDGLSKDFSDNIVNIKKELDFQQKQGADKYWSQGETASVDNATWDMAFRMAENGLGSLRDLGQRTVTETVDGYNGPEQQQRTEYFNKATGEALPAWDRVARSGPLKLKYNLHFTEDGTAIPYTTKETSDWVKFRDDFAKPVGGILLAAYGVPYVATALQGATIGGITLAKGSAALTAVSSAAVSGGVSLLGGASFEDALKNALTSGLTAGATAGYADTIGQSLGFDAGSVASKAAGQAIIAGAKAGITDENVLQSMATAAVTAYLSNKEPAFDATEREGSLAKPGVDDSMTTDFGVNVDYSLTSGLKFPSGEGIKVDQNFDTGIDGPVDYSLTSGTTPFTGLQTTTSPNLTAMGGAQGITATKDDGSTLAGTDFTTGPSLKDVETAVKIGGVLMASDAVIDNTVGSTSITKPPKDIYRDAPLAGFKMVKYEDSASGASKYIPFVGEEALLPPPIGYTRSSFAKGGFVSRRA